MRLKGRGILHPAVSFCLVTKLNPGIHTRESIYFYKSLKHFEKGKKKKKSARHGMRVTCINLLSTSPVRTLHIFTCQWPQNMKLAWISPG